ncbi:MAG: class I SAM-dependent methyltransferase [Anaerolineae bacterium]
MTIADELALLRRTDDPRSYLSAESALLNYIRIADEIAADLPPGARILDWGCGRGQMSFLMARRGFDVTSYDVGQTPAEKVSPLFPEIAIRIGDDPIALPYPDEAFDAALSIGVLEHVPFPAASLAEIYRILAPGGQLFIYNLPQRHSWPEMLRESLGLPGTHRRRFTMADVTTLLTNAGLAVTRARRTNMLPKHLTSMPEGLREAYGRLAPLNLWLDGRLAAVPVVNQVAGILEVAAVKPTPEAD